MYGNVIHSNLFSARKLGEQCLHDLVCQHYDQNALCIQVRHNALCQCRDDFHSVSYLKPTKKIFCTQGNFRYKK